MVNEEEVLKNLSELIGRQFDEDDIIIAFESDNGIIINKVVGQESNFDGFGKCDCYNAYENIENSIIFTIYVSNSNEIVYIK